MKNYSQIKRARIKMESEYVNSYRYLMQQHWWWRARGEFLLKILKKSSLQPKTSSVLEVGCGPGEFLKKLSPYGKLTGLEPHLDSQKHESTFKLIQNDFLSHDFKKERFDLVLLLDVIEHVKEDRDFIEKAYNLLNNDGYLLVTVPAFHALWTNHDNMNHHLRRYSKKQLLDLVSQHQLSLLRLEYFYFWLAPLKVVTRWLEKTIAKKDNSISSLPKIGPLNWLFYLISKVEFLLLFKFRKPFGSSALLFAKKKKATMLYSDGKSE